MHAYIIPVKQVLVTYMYSYNISKRDLPNKSSSLGTTGLGSIAISGWKISSNHVIYIAA